MSEKAQRVDPLLWIIPLVLNCLGIVMIVSLTSPQSMESWGSPFIIGFKQVQWSFLGLCAMFIMYLLPISLWKKVSGPLWVFGFLLSFSTLIPGLGIEAGGAKRWIDVGALQFQPLELLLLATVIHLSKCLTRSELSSSRKFWTITMAMIFFSALPLLMQPDIGGMLLLAVICMGIQVENQGWCYPLIIGIGGISLLFPILIKESYRLRRYVAFLDPWKEPLDSGFQVIQGLVAFANGGLIGVGIGKGLQKMNYLPAAHTDYIFAAIGEEFGFIGTGLVVFLFTIWVVRCYKIYRQAQDPFMRTLLWGLVISVLVPFFINVGGVLKLMPLTGMPLPFISYGGSSLLMMWVRAGLIVRITKEIAGAQS
ncbi:MULTISPECIES: FtsW/RodA/SpoVE family cell cycle protein [Aminobacterium]|uniref:Probable peptidoglycan glycosyltransferase FtsW n=1 Tax=Aminobacterium colombiense (strain DSM 12261 / ALA-1) TaxID=572547 RepID=D5EEG9_AMICL|nr:MULTISPECIES: putative peptidoglycan glycosyltransferase FtsW [Aminobacterium]MDD2378825.1 putative peptidoglycan glycosyltransferase FtsW [Aminobacterium colombiense]ADE56951.1 cell cycle protein [Aminobacterium colombiense DSM 12261]MDD3767633.1 putative peptidoglycan glycosyltransferase FtsW [Aminobacterium colombiense]MDD4265378.1 putative peptidoglycan glycosyltransferase FtsW [Aminobacterium colombiense]MDD4585656.1 putative peptidoglycan glycosyltransferase FtsW [Aminobacterium colom